jgi:hypothetical protein
MLRSEPQILVSWERLDAEPTIEGDFALVADRRCRRACSPSTHGSIQPRRARSKRRRAIADPRRSIRSCCGQLAWPISNSTGASIRQRCDAHPRCLGRASSVVTQLRDSFR